jgi:hypothetical protein
MNQFYGDRNAAVKDSEGLQCGTGKEKIIVCRIERSEISQVFLKLINCFNLS